ncbi:MAG: DUF2313 domain-containing protein [Chitinispirillia bacterium]|nr:DUF2313 domain-containing protein [Chitinispirillia bacterium]MCL2268610.1 DUF2313 domain-containing protein [Chitinispirillia bacterium]
MMHADALKKLIPIALGDISDRDMEIEGALLDSEAATITSTLREWFPSTTEALLEQWEREYGLGIRAGAGIDERRAVLLAQYVYVGNLAKSHFESLCNTLGYEVVITEGGEEYRMFRAGISAAGDPVFAAALMWNWTVKTTNRSPGADLIELLNDLNPPHMKLEFEGP